MAVRSVRGRDRARGLTFSVQKGARTQAAFPHCTSQGIHICRFAVKFNGLHLPSLDGNWAGQPADVASRDSAVFFFFFRAAHLTFEGGSGTLLFRSDVNPDNAETYFQLHHDPQACVSYASMGGADVAAVVLSTLTIFALGARLPRRLPLRFLQGVQRQRSLGFGHICQRRSVARCHAQDGTLNGGFVPARLICVVFASCMEEQQPQNQGLTAPCTVMR